MKCPVCGAKMIDGKICKYCNVTNEQVLMASNKEAKKAFKEKRNSDVCYTTDIPNDVNKRKLVLFTVFLGVFGVNSFYVGRLYKGLYAAISAGLAFLFALLNYFIIEPNVILEWGYSISVWLLVFNVLVWFADIVALLFKKYKVPVVLPESTIKVRHHSIKDIKG